jgi:plastocyanin
MHSSFSSWRASAMVLLLSAAAGSAPATEPNAAAIVRMTDSFTFEPRAVTVHAGDIVEWRNASHFIHSVSADPKLGSALLPQGAAVFASGDLQPGARFRQLLKVPGTYRYFCMEHEGVGMTGEVTVLPAAQ